MAGIRKSELQKRLIDALALSADVEGVVAEDANPLRVRVPEVSEDIAAWVFTLTAPPGGRPDGEAKVQLSTSAQAANRTVRGSLLVDGAWSVLIGVWPGDEHGTADVFVLWDGMRQVDFAAFKNVQTKLDVVHQALRVGIGRLERSNGETVIAARPELLVQALTEHWRATRGRSASAVDPEATLAAQASFSEHALPPTLQPQPSRKRLRGLVVATEWESRHGGISTFNRSLCLALAERADITVVVQELPAHGAPDNLRLVLDDGGDLESLLSGGDVDFVIGHGHVTGVSAHRMADRLPGAVRVHIVHTDPEDVGAWKSVAGVPGAVKSAAEKAVVEQTNIRRAHVVFGVGPKLAGFARKTRARLAPVDQHRVMVEQLLPAIDQVDEADVAIDRHLTAIVLSVGRLKDPTKGLEMFAVAMKALATSGRHPELRWVIRGIEGEVLDDEQRNMVEELGVRIARVRQYSTDVEDLIGDYRQAQLFCMTSHEEGFGLVALEAIAYGTPVLVPDDSGIGRWLDHIYPGDPGVVRQSTLDSQEAVAEAWREAVERALDDPERTRRAARLRRSAVLDYGRWSDLAETVLDVVRRRRAEDGAALREIA